MSRASPPRSIGKGGLGTSTAMLLKAWGLAVEPLHNCTAVYTSVLPVHFNSTEGGQYAQQATASTTNNNTSNKASAEAVATTQYFGGLHVKILQMLSAWETPEVEQTLALVTRDP